MRRLVIAVDCDEVLINTTENFMDQYNRIYGTEVSIENAYLLDHPEFKGVERSQIHDRFSEIANTEEFRRLNPRPDAIEVVHKLADSHELHLVTARQASQESTTLQMIDEYFPGCFTGINHIHEASKGEVCRVIKADVIIDDNAKHILDAKNCGVGVRIWFGNPPWLVHDADFDGFTDKCADWHEAEKVINRLASPSGEY